MNTIGDEGAQSIANALSSNTSLTVLDLNVGTSTTRLKVSLICIAE